MPTIHPVQRTQHSPARYTEIRESIREGHAIAVCWFKGCKRALRVATITVSRRETLYSVGGTPEAPLAAELHRATRTVTYYGEPVAGEWLSLAVWNHYHARRCECGAERIFNEITGRTNPAIKCNARCTGAKGHDCECSCGGANHGKAHG